MAKSYLLNTNGKNEGPFALSELTGKYLRGEIDGSAKLCAVGENSWQAMSDLLRSSAARKRAWPLVLGITLLLVAGWCAVKASANTETPQMRRLQWSLDSLDERVDSVRKDTIKRLYLNENVSSAQFSRAIAEVREAGDEERKRLRSEQQEEFRKVEEVSSRFRIGALASGVVGAGLLFIAARIRPVTRPSLPGVQNSPPSPAQSASKPLVGQPSAPASPNKPPVPPPPVPPPVPKPATPKEPKAFCPACQQKVAFPKQMAGHQIACPACGAMMTLDDVSDISS